MFVIFEELRSLLTFFVILILLLTANVIFNLNYQWEGMAVIVRVYLFIFSFYLIYNFSLLQKEKIIFRYPGFTPLKAHLRTFTAIRVAPFMVIVLVTIAFTFIDYIGQPDWPARPLLEIFNGRYSNTIIYSLILLLILRMRKGPNVTVPFFFMIAALYFIMDKAVYTWTEPGVLISFFKILKLSGFFYLIFYEYSAPLFSSLGSMTLSLFIGSALHGLIILIFFLFSSYAPAQGYLAIKSSHMLMSYGLSFPFERYRKALKIMPDASVAINIIYFSELYGKDTGLDNADWQRVLMIADVKEADQLSVYFLKKGIPVKQRIFLQHIRMYAALQPELLVAGKNFKRYSSFIFQENCRELYNFIHTSTINGALWAVDVMGGIRNRESSQYLIRLLSNLNPLISQRSYQALSKITGDDPSSASGQDINSPDIIMFFSHRIDELYPLLSSK